MKAAGVELDPAGVRPTRQVGCTTVERGRTSNSTVQGDRAVVGDRSRRTIKGHRAVGRRQGSQCGVGRYGQSAVGHTRGTAHSDGCVREGGCAGWPVDRQAGDVGVDVDQAVGRCHGTRDGSINVDYST